MKEKLSRREQEILDILLESGEATVEEVRAALSDPPSYSTARAILGRLEAKRAVQHREDGPRYVYSPRVSKAQARRNAVDRLVRVFYEGSFAKAVTNLVDASANRLSPEELAQIEDAIAAARRGNQTRKRKKKSS